MGSAGPLTEAQAAVHELDLEGLAIAAFLELLDRERSALAGGRMDEVSDLAAEKEGAVAALSRYGEQRGDRLRRAGYRLDADGMRAWLAALAWFPEVASAWGRVSELARDARDRNRTNGMLVALQMQRTQRQLAFLNRAASNEPTYSADGVARSPVRQRSLGEA